MPSISSLPQVVRNAGRLHEVMAVLVKYGLASWLSRISVDWIQKHFQTPQGSAIAELTRDQRIREALTELGPTFIKIGQILGTRPDIVGPQLAEELSRLQSATNPDAPDVVRKTVEAELGQPISDLFRSFEDTPVASASIGQVHRAVLPTGGHVAVKVQHQGIEEQIRNDLEIAMELAKLMETHSSEAALYRPIATVTELRRSITTELDFCAELRNVQSFTYNFRKDKTVLFPTVFPELSTQRVLTMEYLEGTSVSNREALAECGRDLSELAEQGARIFLDMVFRDGLFHADPHPGNLLVLNDGRIGVLDCGMVGRIDETLRDQFEDLLLAAVDGDCERMVDAIVMLGELPDDFDRQSLTMDLSDFFDRYALLAFSDLNVTDALNDATEIIRRQNIRLPARLSMLIRMIAVLEGTARQLSPRFKMLHLLRPYRMQVMKRRLSPTRIRRRMMAAYRRWSHLIDIVPGDVADILEKVKQGRFDVHLDHRRLDRIINRLVLGIVVAALFMGSSLLWSQAVEPSFHGHSVPGVVGCTVAVVLGIRLLAELGRPIDRDR